MPILFGAASRKHPVEDRPDARLVRAVCTASMYHAIVKQDEALRATQCWRTYSRRNIGIFKNGFTHVRARTWLLKSARSQVVIVRSEPELGALRAHRNQG